MTIIDLGRERAKRNAPDSNCISRDADGNPIFKFSLTYRCGNRRFSVDIWARDWKHADAHLKAIKSGAWIDGMVVAEV